MAEITYQMVLSTLQTVGLLVGIFYYIMVLRNQQKNQEMQLETRQAQLFMQIYAHQIERANIPGFDAVLNMEFDSVEEFEEKYGRESNPETFYDWWLYTSYYEGIGVLVRENLVDIKLVALLNGGDVISGWEKFADVTKEYRVKYNWPRWSVEWEHLYNAMIDYASQNPELQLRP